MQKEECKIAWLIVYEIMVRSREPLSLTQSHPGGGQYNCLTLFKSLEEGSLAMINMKGESISLSDTSALISPYKEMFIKDKESLLSRVARGCKVVLNDQPVREIVPLDFFLELLEHEITIDSAWIDSSSYGNYLSSETNNFAAYPLSDKDSYSRHLPWWILSRKGSSIAMCNFETGKLILRSGKEFKLNNGEKKEALEYIKKLNEWQTAIEKTQYELAQHTEWRIRYKGYAQEISNNLDIIRYARQRFHEWEPLKFYINITNAKRAKSTVWFDVRFSGQAIAELKCTNKEIKLSTDKYNKTNESAFGCELSLSAVDWDSPKAKEFRKFYRELFANGKKVNKGNEEHRIESLILTELSRRKDKILRNMASVKISGVRFPMPTPLKASDHATVTYAKQFGGGIDVFARAGTGGINTTLCIMELKDENKASEPPKDAIKQALVYTTFIRELLRSESGEKWWKMFGFGGKVPNKLVLNAVCVMPSNTNNDYSFEKQSLNIGGDDIAKLQYIYFTEKNNKISLVRKSF